MIVECYCRMLLALGYHLTFDPQYTSNHRLKTLKLPNKSVNSVLCDP